MRAVVAIAFVAVIVSVAACVPYHASDAPHVTGIVISARTQLPVVGATLHLDVDGHEPVLTARDGTFDIPEIKHWAFVPLGSDARPGFLLSASAPGFKLQHVFVTVGGPTQFTIKLEPEVQ